MPHRKTWTQVGTPGTSTVTIDVSSQPPQAGEILLFHIVDDQSNDGLPTMPTGFSLLASQFTVTNSSTQWVGIKVANGTESSLTFITDGTSDNVCGSVSAFSAQDPATPLSIPSVLALTDSNQNAPWTQAVALTPAGAGCTLVAFLNSDIWPNGQSVSVNSTYADTGSLSWTTHSDVTNNAFLQCGVGSAVQGSAAATTVTGTGTSSPLNDPTTGNPFFSARSIIVVALRPQAGGGKSDDRHRFRASVLSSGTSTLGTKRSAWPDDALDLGRRDAQDDNYSRAI